MVVVILPRIGDGFAVIIATRKSALTSKMVASSEQPLTGIVDIVVTVLSVFYHNTVSDQHRSLTSFRKSIAYGNERRVQWCRTANCVTEMLERRRGVDIGRIKEAISNLGWV